MKPLPWKKRLSEESGQVLIMAALCMTALMGFTALAVDVGLLYRAKRNIQIAADAGATAGALDYYNVASGAGVSTAAAAAVTANGFTNGTGGVTVVVTNPVTAGAHTGAGTVQVDITQPNPTFFMRVLGRNSMTVGARAVAGMVPGSECMHINNTLTISGKSTIQAPGGGTTCGIYVGNNVDVTGKSNDMNVAYINDAGTLTGNHDTAPAPVITGAPKEDIPAALKITPPTPASYGSCNLPTGCSTGTNGCSSNTRKGITTYTWNPVAGSTLSTGCIGIGGAASTILDINLANVTVAAGLHTFDLGTAGGGGTLTVGNNVTGDTAGETLSVYTGNFSVTSTSNTHLYAPADGATDPYNGVLLLEPTSNTGKITIQWGSADGQFDGIIDAPGASVTLQDNGGSALVTGLIVNNLTMGTGVLNVRSYNSVHSSGPFQTVRLVE